MYVESLLMYPGIECLVQDECLTICPFPPINFPYDRICGKYQHIIYM